MWTENAYYRKTLFSLQLDTFTLLGICDVGEGIISINSTRQCTSCPVNTYKDDDGSGCVECEEGYDTNGQTGVTKCRSITFIRIYT